MQKNRQVVQVVTGRAALDGAGVKLTRSLGTSELEQLDPFLLLDEFCSYDPDDYIGGFPEHPHRGFETVTYMIAGSFEHRDHLGNVGRLEAGSVQWMTAGRGILHSEMPKQESGLVWGFQLWTNLPSADKMQPPRYQEIPATEIPEVHPSEGVTVRVIAGESYGARGPVTKVVTKPLYIDAKLDPEQSFEQKIPAGHNSFCYLFEGLGELGDGSDARTLEAGQLAVLGEGDLLRATASSAGMRFLLIAAQPIEEPVVRYGPFVMNSREEIMQAIHDFQAGSFL